MYVFCTRRDLWPSSSKDKRHKHSSSVNYKKKEEVAGCYDLRLLSNEVRHLFGWQDDSINLIRQGLTEWISPKDEAKGGK